MPRFHGGHLRLRNRFLNDHGDVIDTVVVCEWLDKPVAEAGFANPDRALFLLTARQADDRDGQKAGRAGTSR